MLLGWEFFKIFNRKITSKSIFYMWRSVSLTSAIGQTEGARNFKLFIFDALIWDLLIRKNFELLTNLCLDFENLRNY